MNPLWAYLWPVLSAGLLAGAIGGLVGFRRGLCGPLLVAAILALGAAAVWHWPLGAADRFTTHVEADARDALNDLEMTQVAARLHHGPLSRQLILSGRADDFQSSELVRLLGQLPGVHSVTWSNRGAWLPLVAEAALAAIGGFLAGLFLAYLVELHRRYNAQWNW